MAKRERWYIKNVSNKQVTIGDLPRVPTLSPGRSCDLLDYYTNAEVQQSQYLLTVLTNGWFRLTKVMDDNAQVVSSGVAEEATTTAYTADVVQASSRAIARVLVSLQDDGMTGEIGFLDGRFYGCDGNTWVCLMPGWSDMGL